jgi:hypothetical protein
MSTTTQTPGPGVADIHRGPAQEAHPDPARRRRTKGIKAKGTRVEAGIVDLLRASGWPHAERRALNGTTDRGDVAGVPGIVIEAKSGARLDMPGWMRETEKERVNDGAAYGVLVVKPKGVGDTRVAEWYATMPLGALLRLLREAGYGSEIEA